MSEPSAASQDPSGQNAKPQIVNGMTQGRPWRHILVFSLPLLAGNVLQHVYNLADAIVVGQVVGQNGLVGVGNTSSVILMITSMFVGIGLGAAVLLSQYYGVGDLESLRRLVSTVYSILLPLIAVVVLVSLPLMDPLLRLIKVPNDAFEMSRIYMTIILLGLLGSFGFNLNAGIMQAMGNSLIPFALLCISTVADIGMNVLFVLGFGWGVAGAAASTIIAQTFSWLAGIVYINKRYPFLKIRLFRFEFHWGLLKKAATLGLLSGVNQTLISSGALVLLGLVNSQAGVYGMEFSTGFQAAAKIDAFAVMPIQSIAAAVTTFVAQNMGADRIDRVKKGLKAGLLMSCGFGVLIAVALWPLGPFLLRLFINEADPETVASIVRYGTAYLRNVMPFYVLLAAMTMFHSLLRGAGQMLVPMVSSLLGMWLVRVQAAHLLPQLIQPKDPGNMYYAYAIDWTIGLVFAVAYYFTGHWRKKRLVEASELALLT